MDVNHGEGVSTTVTAGGKDRVQTTYPDGTEMVEEYDSKTGQLFVRRWKSAKAFGRDSGWEYEIGDAPVAGGGMLMPSSTTPTFHSRDEQTTWEWRVRNLPYDKSVYSVTVDEKEQQIVLRTSNKKYFKRWHIPCLRRAGLKLDPDRLDWEHANSTLIVQYEKPENIVAAEQEARIKRLKARAQGTGNKDGDVDCKQS